MAVDDTQPLIAHLIELRKRLLNCIIAVMVIFLALVYFANDIYQLVSAPLIKQMPVGAKWRLVIPSAQAYGAEGAGDLIAPFTPLVFEVELRGATG